MSTQFIGTVRTYPNNSINTSTIFSNRSDNCCMVDAVGSLVLAIDAARVCLNNDDELFFEEQPELWVVYDSISGTVADLDRYLKCFDNIPLGVTFNLTVYIDQPIPNQEDS